MSSSDHWKASGARLSVFVAVAVAGWLAGSSLASGAREVLEGTIVSDLGTKLELSALDGSQRRLLVRTPSGEPSTPAWSPDGSGVAVVRNGSLLIAGVSDGTLERVFSRPGYIGVPRWSPDATRIAFDWTSPRGPCATNSPADRGIYIVDLADRSVAKVTDVERAPLPPRASRFLEAIGWDPSGRRLLYGDWRWPKGGDCGLTVELIGSELFHVPVGGGRPTRIRNAGAGQAEWAPDGSGIAIFGQDCAPTVTHPSGTPRRRLLASGTSTNECYFEGSELAWSPDSKELFVAVDEKVVGIRTRDKRTRTIVRCGGEFFCSLRALSRDGRLLAVEWTDPVDLPRGRLYVVDTVTRKTTTYATPREPHFDVFLP